MTVQDKNQTLQSPGLNYQLLNIYGEGSFLRLCYRMITQGLSNENLPVTVWDDVDIYLNDSGREVLRTFNRLTIDDTPKILQGKPEPKSWWNNLIETLLGGE